MLARALADPHDKALADLRQWLDGARLRRSPSPTATSAGRSTRDDRNRLTMLEKKVVELEATHPGAPARAMVMVDKPSPVEPHVFLRGNPGRPGKASPGSSSRSSRPPSASRSSKGSGRLELAEAIAARTTRSPPG